MAWRLITRPNGHRGEAHGGAEDRERAGVSAAHAPPASAGRVQVPHILGLTAGGCSCQQGRSQSFEAKADRNVILSSLFGASKHHGGR